jgi:hypothetical protein
VEALEDRAVPGGVPGGVVTGSIAALLGAKVASPSHLILPSSKSDGAGDGGPFHLVGFISRSSGEEIPQQ